MEGAREVKLERAGQAQILRAHQRDKDFVKYLRERTLAVLQAFSGHKYLHLSNSDVPLSLLYFIVTTAMGNQTLGEEYTGVMQAHLNAHKIPSLTARTLSVIQECFGERIIVKLSEKLRTVVNDPCTELTPAAVVFLNSFMCRFQMLLPIFVLLHKGIFYLHGRHYTIGKRTTKIDYAKVRGIPSSDNASWGFKVLGIMTLMQCVLRLCQIESREDTIGRCVINKRAGQTCRLCLEATSTTATTCGHLFCWSCLCNWLRTKTQCPLCREHVAPSRIAYLMNL